MACSSISAGSRLYSYTLVSRRVRAVNLQYRNKSRNKHEPIGGHGVNLSGLLAAAPSGRSELGWHTGQGYSDYSRVLRHLGASDMSQMANR